MTLKKFIEELVAPNTLIRLWYPLGNCKHEMVMGDNPKMEHQLVKGAYADSEMIGVTDIFVERSSHVEALNIIISRGKGKEINICEILSKISSWDFFSNNGIINPESEAILSRIKDLKAFIDKTLEQNRIYNEN